MIARFVVFTVLALSLLLAGCGSNSSSPVENGSEAENGAEAAPTPTAAAENMMDAFESGDFYRLIQVLADSSDRRAGKAAGTFWVAPVLPSYLGPMMERHLSYAFEEPVVSGDTARIPAQVTVPDWKGLHGFVGSAFDPVYVAVADSAAPGYYERAQKRLFTLWKEGAKLRGARAEAPALIAEAAAQKERPGWFHMADSMVADYPRQVEEMFGSGSFIEGTWEGHIIAVRTGGGWKPLGIESP